MGVHLSKSRGRFSSFTVHYSSVLSTAQELAAAWISYFLPLFSVVR